MFTDISSRYRAVSLTKPIQIESWCRRSRVFTDGEQVVVFNPAFEHDWLVSHMPRVLEVIEGIYPGEERTIVLMRDDRFKDWSGRHMARPGLRVIVSETRFDD